MDERLTCLDCGTPVAYALGHPYCPRCDDIDEREPAPAVPVKGDAA